MTEGKIISFTDRQQKKKNSQMCWECGCGCTSFYIIMDGTAECCGCGYLAPFKTERV